MLLTSEELVLLHTLHTLLMMTVEFMLSKRPVLIFTAALFFLLKLFSSHIYCIPKLACLVFGYAMAAISQYRYVGRIKPHTTSKLSEPNYGKF